MKRFGVIFLFLVPITLGLVACSNVFEEEKPNITVTLNISNLTDDEFKDVGTKSLEDTNKDDFKNIQFTLEVEHSNMIKNREIVCPSIKEILYSKNKERYWFGERNSQDNKGENFAKYNEKIVFYSDGLDENDIREIFKGEKVKVSWTTSKGEKKEESINLVDTVEFK